MTTPLQTELEKIMEDFYDEYYDAINRADNVNSPDEVFDKYVKYLDKLIKETSK